MSIRAVPFYCPYCAEETLEPLEDETYHCESCDRRFALTFEGLGEPEEE